VDYKIHFIFAGPVLGSALYELGGFSLPFFSVGGTVLVVSSEIKCKDFIFKVVYILCKACSFVMVGSTFSPYYTSR